MNRVRTSAAVLVSTLALSSLATVAASPAHADDASATPCATQQAQVDKATAKLAALTAAFAAHPTHHNLKAKKAQVQRVAHATARLDSCLAAQTS